eukprot:5046991-Prymnesium_polylepis.1
MRSPEGPPAAMRAESSAAAAIPRLRAAHSASSVGGAIGIAAGGRAGTSGGWMPAARHASRASVIFAPHCSHRARDVHSPHSGHSAHAGGSTAASRPAVGGGASRRPASCCPSRCESARCSRYCCLRASAACISSSDIVAMSLNAGKACRAAACSTRNS